ncbi:VOC family protein [Streptacidiphilus sp. PAMC 29251]
MALVIRFMSIPSSDVLGLAEFWGKALGRPARGTATGALIAFADDEDSPGILIEEAPGEGRHTGLALSPAHRVLPDEVVRLVGLGARVVRKYHRGFGFGEVTLADPEGNEFQVVSSTQELRRFEESAEDQEPAGFWDDAEQAPDLTTAGATYATVKSAPAQSQ